MNVVWAYFESFADMLIVQIVRQNHKFCTDLVHEANGRGFEGVLLGQVNSNLPHSALVRRSLDTGATRFSFNLNIDLYLPQKKL